MKLKKEANSPESVGCKCYRPGDPEFEVLASLVTPLHKIRSEFSVSKLYIKKKSQITTGDGMRASMIYMQVVHI
jgi:hypothetical protein